MENLQVSAKRRRETDDDDDATGGLFLPDASSLPQRVSKRRAAAVADDSRPGLFDALGKPEEDDDSGTYLAIKPIKKDKKGREVLEGYEDDFFKGQAPVASRNWIIHNTSLTILADLTGKM
jgi:hypothetical protein